MGPGRASAEAWSRTAGSLAVGFDGGGGARRPPPRGARTCCPWGAACFRQHRLRTCGAFSGLSRRGGIRMASFSGPLPFAGLSVVLLGDSRPPRPRLGLGTGPRAADSARHPAVPLAPALSAGPPLAPAAPRRCPDSRGRTRGPAFCAPHGSARRRHSPRGRACGPVFARAPSLRRPSRGSALLLSRAGDGRGAGCPVGALSSWGGGGGAGGQGSSALRQEPTSHIVPESFSGPVIEGQGASWVGVGVASQDRRGPGEGVKVAFLPPGVAVGRPVTEVGARFVPPPLPRTFACPAPRPSEHAAQPLPATSGGLPAGAPGCALSAVPRVGAGPALLWRMSDVFGRPSRDQVALSEGETVACKGLGGQEKLPGRGRWGSRQRLGLNLFLQGLFLTR